MTFQIGDFVVCPGHGVGQIEALEEKGLSGNFGTNTSSNSFFSIKIISNGMKILVPVHAQESIRPLANKNDIEAVFGLLNDHNIKIENSTWNRRYREYMDCIKTGDICEIAKVVRALYLLKLTKNLSFGERKMLDYSMGLLTTEIALSDGDKTEVVSEKIEGCFSETESL